MRLGCYLHVIGHVGCSQLAQLGDHPIGSQFGAPGALVLGLLDRGANVKFG